MRALLAILAACAVAACATKAEHEGTRISAALTTAMANDKACSDKIQASDEYQFLKDKLPPTGSQAASMELLTNQSKPTANESAVLLKLYNEHIVECRQTRIKGAQAASPSLATVIAQDYADSDALYAQLVQRQISWGFFAQATAKRRTATSQALRQALDQLNRDLAQSHASEIQERRAMANALSQMAYQQQVISALNRPTTTNCVRTGAFVNCTSY